MESRGNLEYSKDGMDIGVNQFGSTLQFGGGYPLNGYEKVYVYPFKCLTCFQQFSIMIDLNIINFEMKTLDL